MRSPASKDRNLAGGWLNIVTNPIPCETEYGSGTSGVDRIVHIKPRRNYFVFPARWISSEQKCVFAGPIQIDIVQHGKPSEAELPNNGIEKVG